MPELQTWENIPKSQADATTIAEAIADATEVHNADAIAHIAALASLGAHRQNLIADHPAESVVNDKMSTFARAYIAIVDPASDTDFDTVQGAIAYAITKGGGTIFLTPGTYYLDGAIDLPANVNLRGADVESVIIHGNFTTTDYFKLKADTVTNQIDQFFEFITFVNDGGGGS